MTTLAIIADDLTGALDTGVKFSKQGINTKVILYTGQPFADENSDVDVIVVCASTRHLSPKDAYDVVYSATKEIADHKIPYLYKKTDSVLRGNIGSELEAVCDASGCSVVPFAPAFPVMNRTTKHGVQLLQGMPIAESVFRNDSLNPVTESDIGKVIALQSGKPVIITDKDHLTDATLHDIVVVDAETDDDLDEIAEACAQHGALHVTAGCAGFASSIEKKLALPHDHDVVTWERQRVIIGCGTINAVTAAQITYAVAHGFAYFDLTAIQRCATMDVLMIESKALATEIAAAYRGGQSVIFTTRAVTDEDVALGSARTQDAQLCRVEQIIALIVEHLCHDGITCPLFIVGGDTISALLKHMSIDSLQPICELTDGVVETELCYEGVVHSVIAKSGGFGTEDLFCNIFE